MPKYIDPELGYYLKSNQIDIEHMLSLPDDEFEKHKNIALSAMKRGKFHLIYDKSKSSFILVQLAITIIVPAFFFKRPAIAFYSFISLLSLLLLTTYTAKAFNQIGNKINYISIANDSLVFFRKKPYEFNFRDIRSITISGETLIKIDIGSRFPIFVLAKVGNFDQFLIEFAKKYKRSTNMNLRMIRKKAPM